MSALCCGGADFGTACKGAAMDALLSAFRDAGGNFVDTAHFYAVLRPGGDGASERALGDYVHRHGRGDLVIATKGGGPPMAGYRRTDAWLSPARVGADLDDSLSRLDVDTIDLFWLHRDDTRMSVGEIVEALNAEIQRGRVRFLGASNWSAARISAANAYAAEHGLQGFVAGQPEWSLACKNIPESELADDSGLAPRFMTADDLSTYRQEKITVIPYAPTARGYFASRGERGCEAYDNALSRARLKRCLEIAATSGAAPGQVALAWLLHQEFPVFPIIGTLDPAHLQEALAAPDLVLTPEQVRSLTCSEQDVGES